MARTPSPHRREHILAAARREFRTNGFDGTHMSDVARRADIAVGTLYLYFASKEDIARAIAVESFASASRVVLPLLAGRLTRAKIAQLVHGTFDAVFADESFGRTGIPLHDVFPTMAPDAYGAVVAAIAEALALQMRAGTVRRNDPGTLADFIVILLRRAVLQAAARPDREREPYASVLIRLLAAALLPSRPTRGRQ